MTFDMSERRTVAFYVPALNLGGAQRVTVDIANGLAGRGYGVDLLLSYRRGELLGEVDDDVRIVPVRTPELPVAGVLASVPALARYLRTARPDVLFSQMTYANVAAILASRLAGGDAVVAATEHDAFGVKSGAKERVVTLAAAALYGFPDRVVGVSEGVAESVREGTRAAEDDVVVLHNPIPTEEVARRAEASTGMEWLESDAFETVLSVGRLDAQKDHATLLRAFASLRERRPDARLVVVGTGELESDLRERASRLGLDDVVAFPGFVDDVFPYMGSASAFALSSRHEGLPTVLIEALAAGCPVVSTDCPSGPREILRDGRDGPLVPVGDHRALGSALETVLADPPAADRLRDRAAAFSSDAAVDDYVDFVESVAGDRGVGARSSVGRSRR